MVRIGEKDGEWVECLFFVYLNPFVLSMLDIQVYKNSLLRYWVALLAAMSLSVSCSTMHSVKVNHNQTEKIVNALYHNNKNAFYMSSSYATFSTVWTYEKDIIVIYRLTKGRVREKQSFQRTGPIQLTELSYEDIEEEIYQNCPMELDGDVFGVVLEIDHKKTFLSFPVDINCMKRGNYNSALLKMIVNDMESYHLWGIE